MEMRSSRTPGMQISRVLGTTRPGPLKCLGPASTALIFTLAGAFEGGYLGICRRCRMKKKPSSAKLLEVSESISKRRAAQTRSTALNVLQANSSPEMAKYKHLAQRPRRPHCKSHQRSLIDGHLLLCHVLSHSPYVY